VDQTFKPPDIVVRHNDDISGDFGQSLTELEALVGNVGAENAYVVVR